MGKMISISEGSEILGVDIRTLQRWDKDGGLKAYRTLGGHRRYKLSEIESPVNDLISVVTCFSTKLYGSRGGRKIKEDLQNSIKELEKEKGENSEDND